MHCKAAEYAEQAEPLYGQLLVAVSDGTSQASTGQDVEVRSVAPTTDAGGALTRHSGLPVTLSGSVTDPSHAEPSPG